MEHEEEQPVIEAHGYDKSYIELSKYRLILLNENITNHIAAELSAMLMYFDHQNSQSPIHLYMNCIGGTVSGLYQIYDTMNLISAPIHTVCVGKCCSAAAILLAAGDKGNRAAYRHSQIMIHGVQAPFPLAGYDINFSQLHFSLIAQDNRQIHQILAQHTGKSINQIEQDCREDTYFNAQQALEYGIVDHIWG